jgi:DNA polymerase III delta prime subunit
MTAIVPYDVKYAPSNFDEVIGHTKIIHILKSLINNNSLPHLLFYGNSGTGKSLVSSIISKILYNKNEALMVLSLHSCDDRGIGAVRENIKSFAEKINMFINGTRMIILDETDSMTTDAQFALRRIIEVYSENVRFILICNNLKKIIPALRARCALFHFMNLTQSNIINRLEYIVNKEKLNIPQYTIEHIAVKSNGDLRKAINSLQRNIQITPIPTIQTLIKLPYKKFFKLVNYYYNLEEALSCIIVDIKKFPSEFIIELCDFEYLSYKTIVEDIHIAYFCTLLHKYKDCFIS